jgi:hypothetical protein
MHLLARYSSGGTPIFLWSRGYGTEGQDDVGSTYKFVLGSPGMRVIVKKHRTDVESTNLLRASAKAFTLMVSHAPILV